MNIALVISGQVPAALYGGTERVVWGLLYALHKLGHKLWLIAPPGSTCPYATLIYPQEGTPLHKQIPEEVNITHFHCPPPADFDRPYIQTIHGNSLPEHIGLNTVFVSRNHAERFGVDSFVHNGLLWEQYPTPQLNKTRKHFHFLGKAAWRVKNVQGAIDTTHLISQAHLDVLGGHRLNFKMGFRLTLSPRIHFYGMVNDEEKAIRIEQSRGLIFPVRWHEPFGLAVIESLYYGAPVFGTPYGSLPELVPSEVGFLTTDKYTLAEHIAQHSYDPKRCHEYAQELFSAERMARDYLKKYERVLSGYTLCHQQAQALDIRRKLPWK